LRRSGARSINPFFPFAGGPSRASPSPSVSDVCHLRRLLVGAFRGSEDCFHASLFFSDLPYPWLISACLAAFFVPGCRRHEAPDKYLLPPLPPTTFSIFTLWKVGKVPTRPRLNGLSPLPAAQRNGEGRNPPRVTHRKSEPLISPLSLPPSNAFLTRLGDFSRRGLSVRTRLHCDNLSRTGSSDEQVSGVDLPFFLSLPLLL